MLLEMGLIFLVSLLYIKLLIIYGPKLGLVAVPNERSTHTEHTPTGAGIGFFLAVVTVSPFFNWTLIENYSWIVLAIVLVFIVGVLDDHKDVSPRSKLIVMFISTLLIYQSNMVISNLGTYFGFELQLGWFALAFTIFAVLSFSNALNLIDGIDGLAGGVSMVILATFYIIGVRYGDALMIVLSGTFLAALAAFMIFNWNPASIFMGDSGSLMLGFVITTVAIKSLDHIPAISILFIAALPIIDTIVVVIRRTRTGRKIFSADHCHIHHVMREFFAGDTKKTVIFLVVMQSIYSITGFQFTLNHDDGIILVLFLLNIAMVYLYLAAMIRRQKRSCGKAKKSLNQ